MRKDKLLFPRTFTILASVGNQKPSDKPSPPGEPAQHQPDHADVEHGLAARAQQLVVLAEPARLGLPSETAFDDPATVPTGRFASVMISILSGGHSQCTGLSSDGDVRRPCRGGDTLASAPVLPHRPTQSSVATPRAPCVPVPRHARSSTAGGWETLPAGRPAPVPTIHPDRAPRGRSHAGACSRVPAGAATSGHGKHSSAIRGATVASRRSRAGGQWRPATSWHASILGRGDRGGRHHSGRCSGQGAVPARLPSGRPQPRESGSAPARSCPVPRPRPARPPVGSSLCGPHPSSWERSTAPEYRRRAK